MKNDVTIQLVPGTVLGNRYQILERRGGGGLSVTCLAQDIRLGGQVVLRALPLPDTTRARLEREVPAALDLLDGHLVPLYDFVRAGAWSILVTGAFPSSMDLGTILADSGRLEPGPVAAIGRSVALGLRAAHRRGLLHRAVAPEHVVLSGDGRIRLAGLGWASAEMEIGGGRPDHLDFIAPEQLTGQSTDPRVDIYGLGLTLFHALTGELPARPGEEHPPCQAEGGHRPSRYRDGIPPWLDAAIARATAALPADRHASAGRFAEALLASADDPLPAQAALS